ncbi:MAG: hypothetical protein ACAI35_03045 [Candidatus Methylacidiphilales bacterium]|nr:hypothetical protein [Candidatus Methylacidiphilales bacterium]
MVATIAVSEAASGNNNALTLTEQQIDHLEKETLRLAALQTEDISYGTDNGASVSYLNHKGAFYCRLKVGLSNRNWIKEYFVLNGRLLKVRCSDERYEHNEDGTLNPNAISRENSVQYSVYFVGLKVAPSSGPGGRWEKPAKYPDEARILEAYIESRDFAGIVDMLTGEQ